MTALEAQFVQLWLDRHGSWMKGEQLWRALGFGSQRAFHRALQNGWREVKLTELPSRRGRCARTEEVAKYAWNEIRVKRLGGAP